MIVSIKSYRSERNIKFGTLLSGQTSEVDEADLEQNPKSLRGNE